MCLITGPPVVTNQLTRLKYRWEPIEAINGTEYKEMCTIRCRVRRKWKTGNSHLNLLRHFLIESLPYKLYSDTTAQLGRRTPHFTVTQTHTHTHTHTRYHSSAQVISLSQRPLPTPFTTNTREEHPCIREIRTRDSSNRTYTLERTATQIGFFLA